MFIKYSTHLFWWFPSSNSRDLNMKKNKPRAFPFFAVVQRSVIRQCRHGIIKRYLFNQSFNQNRIQIIVKHFLHAFFIYSLFIFNAHAILIGGNKYLWKWIYGRVNKMRKIGENYDDGRKIKIEFQDFFIFLLILVLYLQWALRTCGAENMYSNDWVEGKIIQCERK